MDSDPYFDDAHGVLKNKLGITDGDELRRFEEAAALARIDELKRDPIPCNFDEKHLSAIHHHIFQDVYDFAGESRVDRNWDPFKYEEVLDMSSVEYPPCHSDVHGEDLQSHLDDAFNDLATENKLKGLDESRFVERLTHYTSQIWQAHPYREGNTRTNTVFIQQLANEAGHPLDELFPENHREYRDKLALSTVGQSLPLEQELMVAVLPIERAEHEINSLIEKEVSEYLAAQPIEPKLQLTDTADKSYIDAAFKHVEQAKISAEQSVRKILPFHFKRVEIANSVDVSVSNYTKSVQLYKDCARLEVALQRAKEQSLPNDKIEMIEDLLSKKNNEIEDFPRHSEPLSAELTIDAFEEADEYRLSLEVNEYSVDDLITDSFGKGKNAERTDGASANRFLNSKRRMVTAHVERDLRRRSEALETKTEKKAFNQTVKTEHEKRAYAIRSRVHSAYPAKKTLVAELRADYRAKTYFSELKHIHDKSKSLSAEDSSALVKQRVYDNRMQYLTKKLAHDDSLALKLSPKQKETVATTRNAVKERQSRQLEQGLER